MKLVSLLSTINHHIVNGKANVDISGVESNASAIKPGNLFICIKGARADGHDYIDMAVKKGCQAILINKDQKENVLKKKLSITVIEVWDTRYAMGKIAAAYYDYPSKNMIIIGITGTKGKTTTAYLIRSILECAGINTGIIGTIETAYNGISMPAKNTTPESLELQRLFRRMLDAGVECVVMEVSSQALKLNRVNCVDFDYGIFTNLSEDHIGKDEHKDFDEYAHCKSMLFTMCKNAIVNKDDTYWNYMIHKSEAKTYTYGICGDSDYKAYDINLYMKNGKLGVSFKTKGFSNNEISVGLPGRFSVYNALGSIALAHIMGIKNDYIIKGLSDVVIRGRVELVPVSTAFIVIIDYAHNAYSLENILKTLKEYNPGNIISLFGCGGNRSKTRRYNMGLVSGKGADLTIITTDNPRYEDADEIIKDITDGTIASGGKYVIIKDRKDAIRYALHNANKDDIILLAGKGHEEYQEIDGIRYYMNERVLIKDILEEEDVEDICGYNN